MKGTDVGQPAVKSLPLWQRIASDLERLIDEGEFAARFPGELELADRYGVSRGTVRKALQPLRDRGVISSERGRAPRVIDTVGASSYGPIYSLHETVRGWGLRQTNVVLRQGTTRHERVAAKLRLPADTEFFHLARVRLADGTPFAADRLWIPLETARPMLNADFTDVAVYQQLRDKCGVTITGGYEELRPVIADSTLAQALECEQGTAVFKNERLSAGPVGAVEFRETYIVGERLSVVRSFGKGPPPERADGPVDDDEWWKTVE
ncbi:GntR family transcriptional regulator [Spelaeicoccus albus]|nr:GntR family transcriptional regulator [Spelaeicoccus albus]